MLLAFDYTNDGLRPDPERVLSAVDSVSGRLVVVTTTFAYHPTERHIGMAPEARLNRSAPADSPAARWIALEEEILRRRPDATILRSAPLVIEGGPDVWSRFWSRRAARAPIGFDPMVQILAVDDLARAVDAALERAVSGTFNVVPNRNLHLRQALRAAGLIRLPLGRLPADLAPYLTYPFTGRGEKARRVLDFVAEHSTREALGGSSDHRDADPAGLGMDERYIGRFERTLFRFLHDVFWRIEYRGLEHLPTEGGAVLVGVHRGFMPWDGVMMVVGTKRRTGRFLRFLIHPGLIKMPFLTPYMNKLGGVIACRENADYLLGRGDLVGVFPEGIQGAFRYYRDAYQLGRFGRDEYVRMAIRNQVPLIPFATVGSAEIFPIVGKIPWPWLRRTAEWPCLPVTTPFPLPSKWHTAILEPLHVEQSYPPEAANDRALVRSLSATIRARLQTAIDDLVERRPGIFFGSLFDGLQP